MRTRTVNSWGMHKGLGRKLDLHSQLMIPTLSQCQVYSAGWRDSVAFLMDTEGLQDCCGNRPSCVSATSWSPLQDCKLYEGRSTYLSYLFQCPQNPTWRFLINSWYVNEYPSQTFLLIQMVVTISRVHTTLSCHHAVSYTISSAWTACFLLLFPRGLRADFH